MLDCFDDGLSTKEDTTGNVGQPNSADYLFGDWVELLSVLGEQPSPRSVVLALPEASKQTIALVGLQIVVSDVVAVGAVCQRKVADSELVAEFQEVLVETQTLLNCRRKGIVVLTQNDRNG